MDNDELGVGMVGHAFMGAAHSQAWRTAPRVFDLPVQPIMRVLVGRDAERAEQAARRRLRGGSPPTMAARCHARAMSSPERSREHVTGGAGRRTSDSGTDEAR